MHISYKNKMKIKPIGKRILVKTIEFEEKISTGIILLNNNEDKNYKICEILSISEELESQKIFSEGDKIICLKNSGLKISNLSSDKLILELDEIFGIIQ